MVVVGLGIPVSVSFPSMGLSLITQKSMLRISGDRAYNKEDLQTTHFLGTRPA
jgi:hypothetical protein